MHEQFFSSYCDEEIPGGSQHYFCTLKVNIGQFQKSEVIHTITMDYVNGMMQFWNENSDNPTLVGEFQLRLFVDPGVVVV